MQNLSYINRLQDGLQCCYWEPSENVLKFITSKELCKNIQSKVIKALSGAIHVEGVKIHQGKKKDKIVENTGEHIFHEFKLYYY